MVTHNGQSHFSDSEFMALWVVSQLWSFHQKHLGNVLTLTKADSSLWAASLFYSLSLFSSWPRVQGTPMPRLAALEPVWALPYSDSLGEAAKPRDWRDMTCTPSEPDECSMLNIYFCHCCVLEFSWLWLVRLPNGGIYKKFLVVGDCPCQVGIEKNIGGPMVKSRAVSMLKSEFMNRN